MKHKTNFTLFLNIKPRKISPMRFYIYYCKEKKQLEKLIKDRCGVLEGFPTRRSISLAAIKIKSVKYEVFSTNFIFDCCKENKLLDLKLYRFSKNVQYAGFDPMCVLKGKKMWPFKICEDFYKNGSKTQKWDQIEPSAPVTNNVRSSKKLGNKCSKNLRFQNYSQLETILKASSQSPGNDFVYNKMSISDENGLDACKAEKIEITDLFKCRSKFSESSCTNSVNSNICVSPKFEATNKGRENYFSAFSNTEVGDKSNGIISSIENMSLKSQMNNTKQKLKGYYPSLTESKLLEINKSNHNIKRVRNKKCVYDNIEEELRRKQQKRCKCQFSNISEQVLYNHSTTNQLEKEGYRQTYCNRLSDKVTGPFSTAQDTCMSKQSTGMKSKTSTPRHFVCSVACEHNLSGMMEKLQTPSTSQRKCDEFISGCENSFMSTLIENSFHDFSSSSDSSFDEFSKNIFEQISKCGDDTENIAESATRFQKKKLSDNVSNKSLNTASQISNEDGVIEQPAVSVTDNCVYIDEEKCKHFFDKHPSSISTFNQKKNLTDTVNVDMDNESVSFKSDKQSLNKDKTVNYGLSPTDVELQVISTQPKNCNNWEEEAEISNEFSSVGNNTFKFSNEIVSLIKNNFSQHTKRDNIPNHVKSSIIQNLILEVCQRSYISSFTSNGFIYGAILCQPLLKLIREDMHNNHHKIILRSNEPNKNSKNCINENVYNIPSEIIIHDDNIEVCHSEQPQLTKQTNDISISEGFAEVNCFVKPVETQEKLESVFLCPIINEVAKENELYRDNGKSDFKYSESPIYDDDDEALYTDNSCDSKYTTITRKFPKFSENSDSEDMSLQNDELMGKQFPSIKIISSVDKAFPDSQCETFDSDASSVSIHVESMKVKLKDTLKEAISDCESLDFEMKTVSKCVNNSDDGSIVPHTKETNGHYLIQKLPTDDKLADSILSNDNKITWNGRKNKNLCEIKEINGTLSVEDCDQLNDINGCPLLVDGTNSINNINDVHYATCASSQESSYFAGISPDVDLIISYKQ